MDKFEIRKKILQRRLSLSAEEIKNKSRKIYLALIKESEYIISRNILFYVATRSEVQTKEIINKSIRIGKNICVPIILSEHNDLIPSKLINFDRELEKGKKGILEPRKEFHRLFPIKDLELVILPGIAFDLEGNRIGRGLGYYDKFLKKVNPSTRFIALAFEMQIIDKVPIHEKDISVHKIITEDRIITCVSRNKN